MNALLLLVHVLAPVLGLSGAGPMLYGDDLVAEAIEARIREAGPGRVLVAGGDSLHESGAVVRYYRERSFEPAWTRGMRLLPRADAVVAAARRADDHGLTPAHYHADPLLRMADADRRRSDPGRTAELEILLTDAFLRLGRHLAEGRSDPRVVDPEWRTGLRGADVEAALRRAVLDDRAADVLEGLAPAAPAYDRLREVLARVRAVAERGGWDTVPHGPTLRPGDRSVRVAAVRRRLAVETEVHGGAPAPVSGAGGPQLRRPDRPAPVDTLTFDGRLENAVRAFQERHGLTPDGAVGEMTLAALNVPASHRIPQIRANLERWRWLPETLGERHVRVNIAAFDVDVFEGGRPVLHMKAVVGQDYRETPIFSDRIRFLVFSPHWNVPPGIAAKDKLPEIKRDPAWLAGQGMTLFAAGSGRSVDPATVDWSGMTGGEFNRRFWLRQDPGPLNALGGVKFMFPNRYNVYLHDTPSKYLFARAVRDFSSGCIRLEKPVELARWLLGESWTDARIRQSMGRRSELRVDLDAPVPVHVLYLTATVDEDGTPRFFEDHYGRDALVVEGLDHGPDRPLLRPVG